MKKKIMIIIILLVILIGIVIANIKASSNTESVNQTTKSTSDTENNTQDTTSLEKKSTGTSSKTTTTITGTSEIKSALIEKLELHAGYYLEEIYVEENSYIEQGQNILKYTNGEYLTAPYDCYIVSLNIPETSGKCLNNHYIQIESKNMLTVSMKVDETKINQLSVGDEAKITVSSIDKTYTGYITHIGSIASNGKFEVKIEFENDGDIKLGMTSEITISN